MPKRKTNLREPNEDDQKAIYHCDCGDFDVFAHRQEVESRVLQHRRLYCINGAFNPIAMEDFKQKLYANNKDVSYKFLLFNVSHEHFLCYRNGKDAYSQIKMKG
jgi:hypothetical protein